jgi:hypothetical protein
VVAGAQQGQQGGRDRGHAAGEQGARAGGLERGELLLGDGDGRVAVAAVLVALEAALEVVAQLGGVAEGEGGGAGDRGGDGVAGLLPGLAGVDGDGAESGAGAIDGQGAGRVARLAAGRK